MRKVKYLKVGMATELMDVSTQLVYGLIRTGKLQAVRLRQRAFRITESELDSYLERNTVDPEDYHL